MMVEVEIRMPRHDEEAGAIVWESLALVRADENGMNVYGDTSYVPDESVIHVVTGKEIDHTSAPEEWARNLPYAYRSGDVVAVVLHDDDPMDLPPAAPCDEPMIPEPEFSAAEDAVSA
jgi:hypothetical protein